MHFSKNALKCIHLKHEVITQDYKLVSSITLKKLQNSFKKRKKLEYFKDMSF